MVVVVGDDEMTNNTMQSLNDIIQREYKGNTIRAIVIAGEPWFMAADVCDALGISEPHVAYRRLNADEVITRCISTGIRGNPNKKLVSESGLYRLIMQSRKPEAVEFQTWVVRDVLPAIRKDGAYVAGEEKGDQSDWYPWRPTVVLKPVTA